MSRETPKTEFLSELLDHSAREWVLFLEESHFLTCYVIFAKCAFAWEQIRAIVENNLSSSLRLVVLLFIPLDKYKCLFSPWVHAVCALSLASGCLHPLVRMESVRMESVRLFAELPRYSLTHSGTSRPHPHFILTRRDAWGSGWLQRSALRPQNYNTTHLNCVA